MNNLNKFKGTRWYKCDLHLHTTASKCFQDRGVTAEQWVNKAIEQRLDCVAVTDHNTGAGIDDIQKAANGKPLVIFPGVEITCDTSKIHLLVLFDVNKTCKDIEDFLSRCEIPREKFGEQDAYTIKNIFDVVSIANSMRGLVIPAHIDEYNGLEDCSYDIIKRFFELEEIIAVQVVHKPFLNSSLSIAGNGALSQYFQEYYGKAIDENSIKKWYAPVKSVLKYDRAVLTFSDNPHEPHNSRHGLAGIGSRFTWIKMDDNPTL